MRLLLVVAALVVAVPLVWNTVRRDRAERRVHEEADPGASRRDEATNSGASAENTAAPEPRETEVQEWFIASRVIDARTRAPVPGATVRVFLDRRRQLARPLLGEVVTDASGEFHVSVDGVRQGPAVDRYRARIAIDVEAPGYMHGRGAWLGDVPLNAARAFPLLGPNEIVIVPGATIRGRVVDDSGRGVPAATVRAHAVDHSAEKEATTGPDGCFAIGWNTVEAVDVFVTAAGHGRTTKRVDVKALQAMNIGDVSLGHGATIEGIVAYPDGWPLRDAALGFSPDFEDSTSCANGELRTDGDGRFRLTGLPAGRYTLALSRDTTMSVWMLVVQPGTVRFVVKRPRLAVYVVEAAGKPVPIAPIGVMGWMGSAADEAERLYRVTNAITPTVDRAAVSEEHACTDGRLDLYAEDGSFWIVSLVTPGFAVESRGVRLRGLRDHPVELTMREADCGVIAATGSLEGKPIKMGATLREARTGRIFRGYEVPERSGKLLQGIPPGVYRLRFAGSSRTNWALPVDHEVTVRSGQVTRLVVRPRVGARLALRLRGRRGAVIEDVTAIREQDGHEQVLVGWRERGTLGECRQLLEPGVYTIRVRFKKRAPAEGRVELEPKQTTWLRMTLD